MSPKELSQPEPWRVCYQQLAPKLLLFARQWLRCPADAEDAVQAGFVRFWHARPDAQPEHYPLLYAAVRSAALDHLRKEERRQRREQTFYQEQPVEDWENPFGSTSLEQQEESRRLHAALEALPAEQREALVLRIWGELTFEQIATAVGAALPTVAARYRYALNALRKHPFIFTYGRLRA